jgi:hypothetical protein
MLPTIDRVILEAAPGEARAVTFSGNEAWDIAIERPSDGPSEGDIYRARAGAPGPDGGRFFDLGDGRVGLARRVKMVISPIGSRSLALCLGQSAMNFENDWKKIYQKE